MADLIIGERRREARHPVSDVGHAIPQVPGARVLELLDTSAYGLRCRLAQPVRPGRTMPLRLPSGRAMTLMSATVIRCEVCRITRHGVQYDTAWRLERPWRK